MATTYTDNNPTAGDGSRTEFRYTFPVIQTEDVKVALNGVTQATTKYTVDNVSNPTHIDFNTTSIDSSVQETSGAPKSGVRVRVYRETTVGKTNGDEDPKAVFAAGSSIRATDLNANQEQSLMAIHELQDRPIETEDIQNDAITNVKIADDQIDSEHYVAGSIDLEHMSPNSVDSDQYVDGSIDLVHMSPNSVDSDQYVDGSIDLVHMSPNSVDSAQYVDGSIDHEHLANDIIDGDNIQDDVINSEHYVAGSIDEEHIANLQVTRVKIANDAIDGTKIADDSINSEHYVDRSIDTQHIAGSQITANELASDAVTTIKIDDLNVTRPKIANDAIDGTKLADDSINSEHYVDGSIDHVHLANDIIDGDNIQDDVVNSEHIAAGALDNEHYAAGSITSDKLNGATVITASEQGSATTNDTSFLTSAAADARFFNISSGDTIKDGQSFPDNDTTIATTAAINDRIIDIVNDVGGFDIVESEQHFPNTNPQGQAGSAAVLSIKAASGALTPSGTTLTIVNGNLANNANITITGVTSTIPQGFGFIVESTNTLHEYTFHRLVPNATEVTTVAGKAVEIGRLGTAAAVADMAILGTTDVVADMAILATNDVVADLNTLGTAAIVEDLNILGTADVVSDMNTLATSANVTAMDTCATNIASINNASTNISSANNFGDQYQVASSAPSTDGGGNALAAGDLYFDTSANELRVYNGSAFQGGVTATGNLAGTGANTFTGAQTLQGTNPKIVFSDTDNNPDFSIEANSGVLSFRDTTNNATRIEVGTSGVSVTGNIVVSGNVDGRDLAADGTSLDNIEAGNIGTDVTNGNVKLTPNGTGAVEIKGAGGNDGTLQLNCSQNSHGVKIKSPAHSAAASYTLTLPVNDGSANEALITDGNGNLSFSNYYMPVSGGSFIDTVTFAGTNYNAYWNKPHSRFDLNDNVKITFGTSQDLSISHNGSDSVISQTASGTGDLKILSGGAQSIECVKAGAVNIAHNGNTKLSTTSGGVSVTGTIDSTGNLTISNAAPTINFTDSDADDYLLQANGGSFIIYDATANATRFQVNDDGSVDIHAHCDINQGLDVTGNITVTGTVDGVDIAALNTTVGNITTDVVSDTSPQLGGVLNSNGHDIDFADGDKARFGNSQDLQIQHAGGSSYISNTTGNLYIEGNTGQTAIQIVPDGATDLRHNGSKKIETTSAGATVTGNIVTTGTVTAGGVFNSNVSYGGTAIDLGDNQQIHMGASDDFRIFHDSANSYISDVGTGNLYIQGAGLVEIRDPSNAESYAKFNQNGSVQLYYDNAMKLETMADGVIVKDLANNTAQLRLDTAQGASGSLYGDTANSRFGILTTDGEWSLKAYRNGATELYQDNARKFTTTASGCDVMGRSVDCQMNFNNASNTTRYGGIYGYTESGTDLMAFLKSTGYYSFVVLDTGEVRTYGTVRPNVTNGSYHLGTSSNKWGDVHATTLYGDGSNLTNLPGGGKVLQVVHGTLNGSFSNGGGSYAATGCSVQITMSDSNNKVLVMAGGTVNNTSAGSGAFTTIYRGSTNISQHGSHMAGYWQEDNSNNVEQSQFLHTIDTPGAGTHTYEVYIYAHNGAGTAYWGYRNTGVITVMEIEA